MTRQAQQRASTHPRTADVLDLLATAHRHDCGAGTQRHHQRRFLRRAALPPTPIAVNSSTLTTSAGPYQVSRRPPAPAPVAATLVICSRRRPHSLTILPRRRPRPANRIGQFDLKTTAIPGLVEIQTCVGSRTANLLFQRIYWLCRFSRTVNHDRPEVQTLLSRRTPMRATPLVATVYLMRVVADFLIVIGVMLLTGMLGVMAVAVGHVSPHEAPLRPAGHRADGGDAGRRDADGGRPGPSAQMAAGLNANDYARRDFLSKLYLARIRRGKGRRNPLPKQVLKHCRPKVFPFVAVQRKNARNLPGALRNRASVAAANKSWSRSRLKRPL